MEEARDPQESLKIKNHQGRMEWEPMLLPWGSALYHCHCHVGQEPPLLCLCRRRKPGLPTSCSVLYLEQVTVFLSQF